MRLSFLTAAVALFAITAPAFASVRHAARLRKSSHNTVRHAAPTESAMPAERATQIQTALISQGYLSGQPTGVWDATSIAAMQKLQGDNGWQTKMTPSARGLIKLGLGPGSAAAPTDTAH